jgi:hypothetical protein
MANKIALITGATSGIGFETAKVSTLIFEFSAHSISERTLRKT